ncbi:MAG: hypothetical protein ACE147_14660 [Candidatus Methylomirabilales bacterium]
MEVDAQIALRMAKAQIQEAIRHVEHRRAARHRGGGGSLLRRLGAALVWLGHRMQG